LGFWRSKRKNERRKTNREGDEFAFIELGRDVSDGKGEDDSEEHDEALVSDEDEEPSVSGCVRVGEASSGTDKVIKSFMFFEFGSGSGDESPEEQDQLLEDEVRSNSNCQRKKRDEKERRTMTGATRMIQRTMSSTLLMTLTVKGERNTLQIRKVLAIKALLFFIKESFVRKQRNIEQIKGE
jgi:hypothetical protein